MYSKLKVQKLKNIMLKLSYGLSDAFERQQGEGAFGQCIYLGMSCVLLRHHAFSTFQFEMFDSQWPTNCYQPSPVRTLCSRCSASRFRPYHIGAKETDLATLSERSTLSPFQLRAVAHCLAHSNMMALAPCQSTAELQIVLVLTSRRSDPRFFSF